jgi:hypothetical protein
MRRLVSTRRHVPLDVAEEYMLAWLAVGRAVTAAGGRAWLFRGSRHEDQFLEFIEWSGAAEPLRDADVMSAVAQLGAFAAAAAEEEWEEAT